MRYAVCAAILNLLWLGFFVLLAKADERGTYPYAERVVDTAIGVLWLVLPVSLSAIAIVWVFT